MSEPTGSIHVCGLDDLKELACLYRQAYPHATDANVAADIKPQEAAAWLVYRGAGGEVLVALHLQSDGFCWLLAKRDESDSLLVTEGFGALLAEARTVLERYGVRKIELLYAPPIDPLARRLEAEGLIGPAVAVVRTCLFEGHGVKPRKVN